MEFIFCNIDQTGNHIGLNDEQRMRSLEGTWFSEHDLRPGTLNVEHIVIGDCLFTSFVQEIEGQAYFGGIETSVFFWQTPLSLHVKHEVSTANEFYHEE